MKAKLFRYHWLLIFFTVTVFLLLPVFRGFVPIPLDALTGGYYPWLDYKWGYSVGVPIKNASLSDVFSQLYVWRSLAMNQIRSGDFPLWNPYSYSGMPLLANWYSAVIYPLNIFMLVFGNLTGWTLMIGLQLFLSQVLMYLFLRTISRSKIACIIGAVTFSLSGFMMTNLEYVTVSHTFLWLPLVLLILHRYFKEAKTKYLWYLPFVIFMQITAGAIYPLIFSFLICGAYLIYLKFTVHSKVKIFWPMIFILLGIFLSAIQIIPSLELAAKSIRLSDPNIADHNFGLLPVKYLSAFVAPDIFGNPGTNNFTGILGYQEISGYFGLSGLFLFLIALPCLLKRKSSRFWIALAFGFLILAFSNPVSLLVYKYHIPLISSSFASRWLLPFTFAMSVIVSMAASHVAYIKFRFPAVITVFMAVIICALAYFFRGNAVSVRNLVLPGVILAVLAGGLLIIKNPKVRMIFVLMVIFADLGRYYFKFTPFSPLRLDFPVTPVIDYLKSNADNYRVDRESGPVFPPNSLIAYNLFTPSGYDPMSLSENEKYYDLFYNLNPDTYGNNKPAVTRYSELTSYLSPALDLYGVKYLIVLKYDKQNQIRPWGVINQPQLLNHKFHPVFSDGATVVLENTQVLPRALLYTDFLFEPDSDKTLQMLRSGFDFYHRAIIDQPPLNLLSKPGLPTAATITKYTGNQVEIVTSDDKTALLVLTDNTYPGWQGYIDSKPVPLLKAFGIFRGLTVPPGNHRIVFRYFSWTFTAGLGITLFSIMGMLIFVKARKSL